MMTPMKRPTVKVTWQRENIVEALDWEIVSPGSSVRKLTTKAATPTWAPLG